jgi:hypothetical protein
MGEEVSSSLIEKIQKLLRMAEGGTEHEAKVAAAMAERLMVEHNLTIQTVKGTATEEDYTHKTKKEGWTRMPEEDMYTLRLLQDFFFVKVVVNTGRSDYYVNFLGRKENVEVAQHLYIHLRHQYRILYSNFRIANQKRNNANLRRNYYEGITAGITHKLREERSKVQSERGLVVVEDPELKDWVSKKYPNLSSVSGRSRYYDADVQAAGALAGMTVNLLDKKGITNG